MCISEHSSGVFVQLRGVAVSFFFVVVVLSSCQGLAQRQVLLPGSAGVMSKKKRQHESLNVSAVR